MLDFFPLWLPLNNLFSAVFTLHDFLGKLSNHPIPFKKNWSMPYLSFGDFSLFRQVDYLQQANRDLEKQLKDTIDQHVEVTRRANDLEGKNAELLLELKDINRLSKQIEEDKHRDVSIVQSELVETKVL